MIKPTIGIEIGVAQALAPFDESLAVAPYRKHLDHKAVVLMAKHYRLDPANLHFLAKKMSDWRYEPGGVDRDGLYSLSTVNPDGRWDSYEIGGRWTNFIPHARRNTAKGGTLASAKYSDRCLPSFVLTPTGEWLERRRDYIASDWKDHKLEKMADNEWLVLVRRTLRHWPDYQVVCVDIHS